MHISQFQQVGGADLEHLDFDCLQSRHEGLTIVLELVMLSQLLDGNAHARQNMSLIKALTLRKIGVSNIH